VDNLVTVFCKPWPDLSIDRLLTLTDSLGFDGVELPVRDGYPINPNNVATELAKASRAFQARGKTIHSIAGHPDEKTIQACAEAGVSLIRICIPIDMKVGYRATEKKVRSWFDSLVPSLERTGVAIGVQNHCDYMVGSAIGLMHLIESYDPKLIGAVLDPAHCAVDGEPEDMAIDIVWSHLRMVNLKAASHQRTNGPDEEEARWRVLWTTAQHSGFSWRTVVGELKRRGYSGPICLPAEYSDPLGAEQLMGDPVKKLVEKDLRYYKSLMAEKSVAGGVQ